MRGNCRSLILVVAAAVGVLAGGEARAQSAVCKPEEIFAVVDQTGQRLREVNSEVQPRLRARLQELGKKNGWAESDLESKGRTAVEDDTIRSLDQRAADLLADLDRLADSEQGSDSVCRRLDEARTKSGQLIEVTQQRSTHALARIDLALKPPAAAAQSTPVAPPPAAPAPPNQIASAETQPRPSVPPARAKAAPPAHWESSTVVRQVDAATSVPPPPLPPPMVVAPPQQAQEPEVITFSPEEIRTAGRGFFGSISAGLAGVIDYAFQHYGRPTGYILGDEGGGAFFAGLRYGQGRLVTKAQGERRLYWQGPSAGFDFGLAGSQVMFLVYSIEDQQQILQRFTGIDGSAYLVGGVGITFLKRGKIILAPIRTGLGLRVGASVGYLKFTSSPSLNPF